MGLNRNLGQLTEVLTEFNGNVLLNPNNTVGGTNVYIGQTMASNDTWRIYGNTVALDRGEMVFELGDNASSHSANGQRFRFYYDNISSGTAKNPFILDYNDATFNTNASFTGNVGIGTTSPNEKLTVTDGKLFLTEADNSIGGKIYGYKDTSVNLFSGGLKFETRFFNGSAYVYRDVMTINSSGNVGIGTTNPSHKLHISDPSTIAMITSTATSGFAFANLTLSAHNGTSVVANGSIFLTNNTAVYGQILPNQVNIYGSASNGIRIVTAVAPIIFSTGSTDADFSVERMRVASNGNVGIGTPNPSDKLTIISPFQGVALRWTDNASNTGYLRIRPGAAAIGADDNLFLETQGTTRAIIYANGNYQFFGSNISDERAKKNINPLEFNAIEKVIALQPKSYYMKNDSEKIRYGFIAQEVNEIIPDLITGDFNDKGFAGLDYNGIIPVLVKAIQEQQEIIKQLENRIINLENK